MTHELDTAIRSALGDIIAKRPDPNRLRPHDPIDRVDRRSRWLVPAMAIAGVLLVGGIVVATTRRADRAPAENGADQESAPAAVPCQPPDTLPFLPTNLPAESVDLQLDPTSHVAVWSVPGGRIEVWNGIRSDLPLPLATSARWISVLDRQATIGAISDGYSVVFDLGTTACERWAIVAHPGTTVAELEAVATTLRLVE